MMAYSNHQGALVVFLFAIQRSMKNAAEVPWTQVFMESGWFFYDLRNIAFFGSS
jgi:hypothetical protein